MYLKVSVHPKSRKEEIVKTSDCRFEIWVREKAERNMANQRVIKIIADYFKIKDRDVRIVSGHRSYNKLLNITAPLDTHPHP